jgi:hypothetical protein
VRGGDRQEPDESSEPTVRLKEPAREETKGDFIFLGLGPTCFEFCVVQDSGPPSRTP